MRHLSTNCCGANFVRAIPSSTCFSLRVTTTFTDLVRNKIVLPPGDRHTLIPETGVRKARGTNDVHHPRSTPPLAVGPRSSITGLGIGLRSPASAFGYRHRPSVTGIGLRSPASAFGHQPSVTGFRSPAFGHRLSVTGFRSPAFGHRLSVTGFRSPAFGHRLSVTGLRSPAFGLRPSATGLRPSVSAPDYDLRRAVLDRPAQL
jgi:hypothetical protein